MRIAGLVGLYVLVTLVHAIGVAQQGFVVNAVFGGLLYALAAAAYAAGQAQR